MAVTAPILRSERRDHRARFRSRRQALVGLGSPAGEEGHRVRQDRGVGLGMRGGAEADQRLADHVVQADPGGIDRVAAEQGAERQRRRGRARRGPGRGRRRSVRRRAARPSRRPGWRAACRGSRRRGQARSSSWRAGPARAGGHRLRDRRSPARAGPPRAPPRPRRAGGGCRSSPPPTSSSGSPRPAAPAPPRPPSRCRRPGRRRGRRGGRARTPLPREGCERVQQRRGGGRDLPGRDLVHAARRGGQLRRARQRPRRCSATRSRRSRARPSSFAAPLDPAAAEDDGAAGVAPDEVGRHPAAADPRVDDRAQVRFDLGRAGARSRAAARASRPRCSSGSSTVKPGPSVAISKSTPLGSRK